MRPVYADGMANSVDPDQTAHSGADYSGSTLFDPDLSVRKLRIIIIMVPLFANRQTKQKIIVILSFWTDRSVQTV